MLSGQSSPGYNDDEGNGEKDHREVDQHGMDQGKSFQTEDEKGVRLNYFQIQQS